MYHTFCISFNIVIAIENVVRIVFALDLQQSIEMRAVRALRALIRTENVDVACIRYDLNRMKKNSKKKKHSIYRRHPLQTTRNDRQQHYAFQSLTRQRVGVRAERARRRRAESTRPFDPNAILLLVAVIVVIA
jgi:hypothetical protein